jgi:GntR family transcriptional regulator
MPQRQDDQVPIPMSSADIAADLTERIRRGEYPPGSQLPTYASLAALYNVGVTTIAKVMVLLKERQVVVGVQGHGTFVPEK